MTADAQLRPAFDGLPSVRANIGGEELLLTRFRQGASAAPIVVDAAPEDAFALVFVVQPLPAHDLWVDGRRIDVPAGPAHSLAIVDLAASVTARVAGTMDSLHFRMSRAALDRFCEAHGGKGYTRLRVDKGPFSGVDPVIGALSPALIRVLCAGGGSDLFSSHLLLTLAAHAIDSYGERHVPAPPMRGGLAPWQVRRAMDLLDPQDGPAPSLADVAGACGVSVAHFSRGFRASVGQAPWTWHQLRRVEQAQQLLRDPDLSIAEVAACAGFSDQSHFTRAFSKHFGSSPAQWRRAHGVRSYSLNFDQDRPLAIRTIPASWPRGGQ